MPTVHQALLLLLLLSRFSRVRFCDPMDCSIPGFSVHGILQARTLEWVAISFSISEGWGSPNRENRLQVSDVFSLSLKLQEEANYKCQIFFFPYSIQIRRRHWHPTPVLWHGKSHGRRSLAGCSPWVRKESEMTERLHFHFSLSCIGEGNGNPLQCSCLENPKDGEA